MLRRAWIGRSPHRLARSRAWFHCTRLGEIICKAGGRGIEPSQVSEARPGVPGCVELENALWTAPTQLLFEDVFDLPDLLLDFAEILFGFAFNLQVRIVCHFARRLFDGTFYFMDISADFVFCTRLHLFSPFRQFAHARGSPRRGVVLHSNSCPTSELQQAIKEGTIALQGNAQVLSGHVVPLVPLLLQA